jgi:hypothetical protein
MPHEKVFSRQVFCFMLKSTDEVKQALARVQAQPGARQQR